MFLGKGEEDHNDLNQLEKNTLFSVKVLKIMYRSRNLKKEISLLLFNETL